MQGMQVNIHEAKTHLSRLLQRVANGEEITISRAGVPVAKLIPVASTSVSRPLGAMQGQIYIADDFDAPLPHDLLALFYGDEPKRKHPVTARPRKTEKKRSRS
jgi:prevent-host-death family protein